MPWWKGRGIMRLQLTSDSVEGPQAAGRRKVINLRLSSFMKSGWTDEYGVSEERGEGKGKPYLLFFSPRV